LEELEVKRVLIIDDDPQIRAVIRRKLNRAGYTIEEAAHGKEALRLIQAKNIDAAIIDIVMPE
jgi:CheY-like chemotaxis protein